MMQISGLEGAARNTAPVKEAMLRKPRRSRRFSMYSLMVMGRESSTGYSKRFLDEIMRRRTENTSSWRSRTVPWTNCQLGQETKTKNYERRARRRRARRTVAATGRARDLGGGAAKMVLQRSRYDVNPGRREDPVVGNAMHCSSVRVGGQATSSSSVENGRRCPHSWAS